MSYLRGGQPSVARPRSVMIATPSIRPPVLTILAVASPTRNVPQWRAAIGTCRSPMDLTAAPMPRQAEQKSLQACPAQERSPFDPKVFLATVDCGRTISKYRTHQEVFSQGSPADAVFYILTGRVKITVLSEQGKEAVVAILAQDSFFGEGCLTGQPLRMATAMAMTECEIMRLQKTAIIRVLHEEPAFSEMFIAHLLARTIRVESDLIDQLFNSSEKRLARALLLLANFGKEGRPEPIIANISQATLAEMIGTTRPRVTHFMNKFRQLGFIEYNGALKVHSSLLSVVLHDQPQIKSEGM
jgi:CRP/FNR family cyclic AMP-dependent transcriptional regulator